MATGDLFLDVAAPATTPPGGTTLIASAVAVWTAGPTGPAGLGDVIARIPYGPPGHRAGAAAGHRAATAAGHLAPSAPGHII